MIWQYHFDSAINKCFTSLNNYRLTGRSWFDVQIAYINCVHVYVLVVVKYTLKPTVLLGNVSKPLRVWAHAYMCPQKYLQSLPLHVWHRLDLNGGFPKALCNLKTGFCTAAGQQPTPGRQTNRQRQRERDCWGAEMTHLTSSCTDWQNIWFVWRWLEVSSSMSAAFENVSWSNNWKFFRSFQCFS